MIRQSYQQARLSVKETFEFVNRITPADVLEYFEASPHLCQYVDDLRRAPLFTAQAVQDAPENDLQLQQDVQALERTFGPCSALSLADVAELLTGSRYYSGGTYYRLKRVLAAYGSSSDGPNKDYPTPNAIYGRLAA